MKETDIAVSVYQVVRNRIKSEHQEIDDETLSDTLEGITNLHEIRGGRRSSGTLRRSSGQWTKGLHHDASGAEQRASANEQPSGVASPATP